MKLIKKSINKKINPNNMKFKVPGKVMLNGAYLVLKGEEGISTAINSYLNVNMEKTKDDQLIQLRLKNQEYTFNYQDNKWNTRSHHSDSKFLSELLNETIKLKSGGLKIETTYDDGFWIDDKTKTGIGSSACILVMFTAIGRCLRGENIHDIRGLLKNVQDVNGIINKGSSGCDVSVCVMGPIIYSKAETKKLKIKEKYLIMGSRGSSTSTREMQKKITVDTNWQNLRNINREIIEGYLKYEQYLDEIRKISKQIVPDFQYEVLKKTFIIGVEKCGVSGSGGEDAVWALVDNPEPVETLWKKYFQYVKRTEIVNQGIVYEN